MTQPPASQDQSDNSGWIQVHATVPATAVDALQDTLLDAGALAITLSETTEEDALWEPEPGTSPLWQNTRVTGLFAAEAMADGLKKEQLLAELAPFQIVDLRWEGLADRQWTREWLKHFKPLLIENKLQITPTDYSAENANTPLVSAPEGAVQLLLDPGLAFGTGTHPTTQLCLAWLCQQAHTGKLAGAMVVDYGCGSGILGIAALLLGAKSVIAIDTDPQALLATQANAEKNGVADRISLGAPELLKSETDCADILIANILAEPLHQLRRHFADLLKPAGEWAISGLLETQAETISQAYQEIFQVDAPTIQGDWARLQGNM